MFCWSDGQNQVGSSDDEGVGKALRTAGGLATAMAQVEIITFPNYKRRLTL